MTRHDGATRTISGTRIQVFRSRNRNGLRNKTRTSRSAYGRKAKRGDFYGKWENGKCLTPERINK